MKLKIKKWALTCHAHERLLERKITITELTSIIEHPEDIIKQGTKVILTKTFSDRGDNKIAAVVIEKQGENLWLVITVMVNFQKNQ